MDGNANDSRGNSIAIRGIGGGHGNQAGVAIRHQIANPFCTLHKRTQKVVQLPPKAGRKRFGDKNTVSVPLLSRVDNSTDQYSWRKRIRRAKLESMAKVEGRKSTVCGNESSAKS